jgi:hypothetical protein
VPGRRDGIYTRRSSALNAEEYIDVRLNKRDKIVEESKKKTKIKRNRE